MFPISSDDNLDCWVGRAATIMVSVGGGLAVLMLSALVISAVT